MNKLYKVKLIISVFYRILSYKAMIISNQSITDLDHWVVGCLKTPWMISIRAKTLPLGKSSPVPQQHAEPLSE